ncbi:MAG: hypothetical protein LM563_05270 [Thermofilum sp.]|nr:hypothetical protein [Thermofilum sp.]
MYCAMPSWNHLVFSLATTPAAPRNTWTISWMTVVSWYPGAYLMRARLSIIGPLPPTFTSSPLTKPSAQRPPMLCSGR